MIVDTGSHLVGYPCEGCDHCGHHLEPAFDISNLSTSLLLSLSFHCCRHCQRHYCCHCYFIVVVITVIVVVIVIAVAVIIGLLKASVYVALVAVRC